MKSKRARQAEVTDLGLFSQLVLRRLNLVKRLFYLDSKSLEEELFQKYELFQQHAFTLQAFLKSPKLKLIKTEEFIYLGEVQGGRVKHGRGITFYRNGRMCEAQYHSGKKNGLGLQIYSSGNLFIGEFYQNQRHGRGIFYWFNSVETDEPDLGIHPPRPAPQKYEGRWLAGYPCGQGTHLHSNGDYYQGQFLNGLKHGKGKQWFMNGDFFQGSFCNGQPQGYGEYKWKDGSLFKGAFRQGLRSGQGEWRSASGKQFYRGNYLLNKKNGHGEFFFENGMEYRGQFRDDRMHGQGELSIGGSIRFVTVRQGAIVEQDIVDTHLTPVKGKKSGQSSPNKTKKKPLKKQPAIDL